MEDRKLGAKLFPKIAEVILDEDNCYPEIFTAFRKHYSLDDLPAEIPSVWAYYWARLIGDRDVMRDRVTDSYWAYEWARTIGDREIMRDRITY